MSEQSMEERVARAIAGANYPGASQSDIDEMWEGFSLEAEAAIKAMREPTGAQWGGVARHIIMWMDMQPKTPRALFTHLERSGVDVPQWLRDEPEMQALDHVPSKGTRAAIVYRAMIDAALVGEVG